MNDWYEHYMAIPEETLAKEYDTYKNHEKLQVSEALENAVEDRL
jgi:hypothetical protein